MLNIASYLVVVCGLGLCSALTRYIPELTARRNRRALVQLLWKSALLQLMAVLGVSGVLLLSSPFLQRLFNVEHVARFPFYLLLACGLAALWLLKDFIGTVFTSVFKARIVAMLSLGQGLLWLLAIVAVFWLRPEIGSVFMAQMVSVAAVYSLGTLLLVRHLHALPWHADEAGIGRRRTLSFSGVVMLNSMLRMVMFKYSEVFFIAAVGGATLAGIYDIGYTLPYTGITFIPLALVALFTSAFAEAYVRDPGCLGRLINSYYKLLIMVSLPVAVLGAYFAPAAFRIIYRGEMDQAGLLASAFCLVVCLPLFSMPLSAAIKAKEKMLDMVPTLLLQIVVNLALDWLLIVKLRLGLWGGIGAVLGTFVLTIPVRLAVVRTVVGGVHFPTRFFLRVLATLAIEGGILFWIVRQSRLLERFDNHLLNIVLLMGVGGVYLLLFLALLRMHRVVRHEDIEGFHALGIERLNKVLRFLVQ